MWSDLREAGKTDWEFAKCWELRELFKCDTPLVMMLSLYMFQFTMLFTI